MCMTYRAICEVLERDGRLSEAIMCFREVQNELTLDGSIDKERAQWEMSE